MVQIAQDRFELEIQVFVQAIDEFMLLSSCRSVLHSCVGRRYQKRETCARRTDRLPASSHVVPGITHHQVYNQSFEEATRLALNWFSERLNQGLGVLAAKHEARP